jgi:hypothetical protein
MGATVFELIGMLRSAQHDNLGAYKLLNPTPRSPHLC